jgi:hypothetical protein
MRNPTIQVVVTNEVYNKIQEAADGNGISMSGYISRILEGLYKTDQKIRRKQSKNRE